MYYVDLSQSYNATYENDGLASSTPWGGIAGLNRVMAAIAAGGTCLVKPGAYNDTRNFKAITFDNLAGGSFAAGELITNTTETGTLRVLSVAGSIIYGSLVTGTFADNDSFNNGSGVSADVNGTPAMPGVMVATTSGTTQAPISIIGVNASWTDDGVCASIIDGNGTALTIEVNAKSNYVWKNIHARRSFGSGFKGTTAASCTYHIFINCKSTENGGSGIENFQRATFKGCSLNANGVNGVLDGTAHNVINTQIIGNTQYGMSYATACSFGNCVIAKNGLGAIYFSNTGPQTVRSCVIADNGTTSSHHGIITSGTLQLNVIKCRITGNSGAPISVNATSRIYEDENVILSNGNSNTIANAGSLVSGGASVYTGTAGYINSGINNYAPSMAATNRRLSSQVGAV